MSPPRPPTMDAIYRKPGRPPAAKALIQDASLKQRRRRQMIKDERQAALSPEERARKLELDVRRLLKLQERTAKKAAKQADREAAREAKRKEKNTRGQADYHRKKEKKTIKAEEERKQAEIRKYKAERCERFNKQQKELVNEDERRKHMERAWTKTVKQRDRTYFASWIQSQRNILKGQPGSCTEQNKCLRYFSVYDDEVDSVMMSDEWPCLMVIEDREHFQGGNRTTSRYMINDWLSSKPDIEVQVFGTQLKGLNTIMSTSKFISKWETARGSFSCRPMNALNIQAINLEITPPPLLRHCTMLTDIISKVSLNVGKKVFKIQSADIEGCMHFQILEQAGAFSGWHMDALAPFTRVTLEGNDEADQDKDVLKYWAVIMIDHLSESEKNNALKDFAKYGATWQPHPSLIQVIALTRGMTLIMPPGTIHAPITVTNCLFRGGMCWDKRLFVSHHLPKWKWILTHRDKVTNEDPHLQTSTIIKGIIKDIERNPESYKISTTEQESVIKQCNDILELSQRCTHLGNCVDCYCKSKGYVCSQYCTCSCFPEESDLKLKLAMLESESESEGEERDEGEEMGEE